MSHLDLRGQKTSLPPDFNLEKTKDLARIVRGLAFLAIESARSGHPGGSSSKVEQFLTLLLGGFLAFDPLNPKHPSRDRMVWSAGHCSPLLYSALALIYESLRRADIKFDQEKIQAVLPEHLLNFRHADGLAGHIESHYLLADMSTGSSGHGLSGAAGLAALHQSCGLKTKIWVMMGDAETEEGMSYEARNLVNALGLTNLIVSLDYNHFGIDGDISEVIATPYQNHWSALGWNVIETDGHDFGQLWTAYQKTQEIDNQHPTVIICHTVKGLYYGQNEGKSDSHGSPAKHEEYVSIMKKLGFEIKGEEKKLADDLKVILEALTPARRDYLLKCLDKNKEKLPEEKKQAALMKETLKNRPLTHPLSIKRPPTLPPELIFPEGEMAPTRKATEAWFKWLMQQTAFFYLGAGDLMKSILTGAAENVYGIINKDNPLGRGFRFGIAEQNMAMLSTTLTQDILPGGFQAVSAFASYGVFTSLMANSVRMALINNAVNPANKGFFIMLAAHDGPETGEDGPTHQGLFWMALFQAYPGIKVYKPLDANETIEMLFYALEKGEPIALSIVRPATLVFKRGTEVPPAREAVNGAYVFKPFKENRKQKLVLAVAGGQMMSNLLAVLPELENQGLDIKIVAVTSPELFEELKKRDQAKAQSIFSEEDRKIVLTLHNGWPGFLYPFLLPSDYPRRAIGINQFLKSGPPGEVYEVADLHPEGLLKKIIKAVS